MGFFPFFPLLPSASSVLALIAGGSVPGSLTVAGTLSTTGLNNISASGNLISSLGNVTASAGSFDASAAGQGVKVAEGANAKQGTAVLAAGAVTVANTSVTANSRILVTSNVDGGTPGFVRVSARSVGTSFTITSSSGTDTSTVAWEIFEPG